MVPNIVLAADLRGCGGGGIDVVSPAAVRLSYSKTCTDVKEDVIVMQAGPQQQTVPGVLGEGVSTGLSPNRRTSKMTEILSPGGLNCQYSGHG